MVIESTQITSTTTKSKPLYLPMQVWSFLRRWPIIPAVVLVVLVFTAIFADNIAPADPIKQSLDLRNAPPYWFDEGTTENILGADHLGRDVLSRIIHGARITLLISTVALISGLIVGTGLGLVAGWFGGTLDEVIARVVDIWLALPFILVAVVVVMSFGQTLSILMVVLALTAWPAFVRNIRAEVLTLKTRDYVLMARVCDASTFRILFKHILPGVTNIILVIATLRVGGLILAEATLSFLGAGIPAPTPAWGVMISDGRDYLDSAWWISVFPGIAIFSVVMSLNFLGDWLRDRLDPTLRQVD
jgi:peptide/nickel transport system permease protein